MNMQSNRRVIFLFCTLNISLFCTAMEKEGLPKITLNILDRISEKLLKKENFEVTLKPNDFILVPTVQLLLGLDDNTSLEEKKYHMKLCLEEIKDVYQNIFSDENLDIADFMKNKNVTGRLPYITLTSHGQGIEDVSVYVKLKNYNVKGYTLNIKVPQEADESSLKDLAGAIKCMVSPTTLGQTFAKHDSNNKSDKNLDPDQTKGQKKIDLKGSKALSYKNSIATILDLIEKDKELRSLTNIDQEKNNPTDNEQKEKLNSGPSYFSFFSYFFAGLSFFGLSWFETSLPAASSYKSVLRDLKIPYFISSFFVMTGLSKKFAHKEK